MNSKKVVILGIEGMLGHTLGSVLSKNFEVIGTSRNLLNSTNTIRKLLPNLNIYENLNVLNTDSLKNFIETAQPQYVVNCVGVIKQKMNPSSYLDCIEINSALPKMEG